MASKTVRHSALSTTTEVFYGHLQRHVSRQAVEGIDRALNAVERATQAA
ncbi:hypothetical protein K1T35_34440 [Pseudonocardia sp. DSM 110487]|jgi:hypothetical protein|nr:hypothetical protein [Pseudonocardia sp. DSM 110487]QYN33555.1 hypothetical protein K1T35_34440 [Pseudonocardia sp. DSM 110487]